MSLSSVIYSRLSTFSGLTALIGLRIYPNVLPQATELPALVYQIIDTVPVHSMRTSSGMAQARVQIDAYDEDYSQMLLISDQISLALSRYKNAAADPVLHDTKTIDSQFLFEPELELHRCRYDFLFIITE